MPSAWAAWEAKEALLEEKQALCCYSLFETFFFHTSSTKRTVEGRILSEIQPKMLSVHQLDSGRPWASFSAPCFPGPADYSQAQSQSRSTCPTVFIFIYISIYLSGHLPVSPVHFDFSNSVVVDINETPQAAWCQGWCSVGRGGCLVGGGEGSLGHLSKQS